MRIKRKIKKINKILFPEKYIKNMLKGKRFGGIIKTPVPKEEEDYFDWNWYNGYIAFRGKPFVYQIGQAVFQVFQLSKDDLIDLLEQSQINSYDPLLALTQPVNCFAKILDKYGLVRYYFRHHTSIKAVTGIVSEFILFCTSFKKKIWDINPKGIIQREIAELLTSSQKTLPYAESLVFQKIGTKLFDIHMS